MDRFQLIDRLNSIIDQAKFIRNNNIEWKMELSSLRYEIERLKEMVKGLKAD